MLLRGERRRVVAAALDRAGAAGGRARVVLRHPDLDGLALAEVRGGRGGDDAEQVLGRRAVDAEAPLGRDHERAQVQALALAFRHPVPVLGDEQLEGPDERLLGKLGHRHPAAA